MKPVLLMLGCLCVMPLVQATSFHKFAKLTPGVKCDPDQTDCPAGCCPVANWYCCPDPIFYGCAATAEDCPFSATNLKLAKLTAKLPAKQQCGPDETDCPNGCCPMPDWYCCPDNG